MHSKSIKAVQKQQTCTSKKSSTKQETDVIRDTFSQQPNCSSILRRHPQRYRLEGATVLPVKTAAKQNEPKQSGE